MSGKALLGLIVTVVGSTFGCSLSPVMKWVQPVSAHVENAASRPASDNCTVRLPRTWSRELGAGQVRTPSGITLIPVAAAPDGRHLFGELYTNTWSGIVRATSSSLTYNRVFRFTGRQDQVELAAFDGRWLVWSVGHSFATYDDWDLYAWDAHTHRTTHIATVPRINGHPIPGPIVAPVVDHGVLAWTQSTPTGNTILHLYNLRRESDHILATGHPGPPVFAWPWIVWEQASGPGRPEPLVFASATTGKIVATPSPVARVRTAAFLSGSPNMLAWVSSDLRSVWLWSSHSRRPIKVFSVPQGDAAQFPSLGEAILTWQGTRSGYVADLRTRAVTRVTPFAVSLLARGRGLVMSYAATGVKSIHPSQRVFLVNTAKLPHLQGCR